MSNLSIKDYYGKTILRQKFYITNYPNLIFLTSIIYNPNLKSVFLITCYSRPLSHAFYTVVNKNTAVSASYSACFSLNVMIKRTTSYIKSFRYSHGCWTRSAAQCSTCPRRYCRDDSTGPNQSTCGPAVSCSSLCWLAVSQPRHSYTVGR